MIFEILLSLGLFALIYLSIMGILILWNREEVKDVKSKKR